MKLLDYVKGTYNIYLALLSQITMNLDCAAVIIFLFIDTKMISNICLLYPIKYEILLINRSIELI